MKQKKTLNQKKTNNDEKRIDIEGDKLIKDGKYRNNMKI